MIFNIEDITAYTYESVKEAYDSGIRDFHFHIDSLGGELYPALRIYDLLRGDSENIVSAHVEGSCISAATVLLLAAPLERRSATKNSTFLIHSPSIFVIDDVNSKGADRLKSDIDTAYAQLKNIYTERTTIGEAVDSYMDSEKSFFADEAKTLGFISKINEMYNCKPKNNMNKLKNFVLSIIQQLKNEKFKTADGTEFEAISLETGVPVSGLEDGVYELETGEVITIENGIIIDIIPKKEPKPDDEPKPDPEPGSDDPDINNDPNPDPEPDPDPEPSLTEEEIRQIVREEIEKLKDEMTNKYKPLVDLVNSFGGKEKLEALKNAKPADASFNSDVNKPVEKKRRSLEEIMNQVDSKKKSGIK